MTPPVIVSAAADSPNSRLRVVHAVMLDGHGRRFLVLCEKVLLANLAREQDVKPVDCPRCLRAIRQDNQKGGRMNPYQRPLPILGTLVERDFDEWIDTPAGAYVESEVTRLALEDLAAGERRGEINFYLATVRRGSRGLTKDRRGYACNNSHRSLLARRLMERRPELAGFFETRNLRGRAA